MNNKIKFGLLLLAVSALVLVPLASALPSYATKTGASCGTCHVSPGGGGTLTKAGTTFKNTGSLPAATPPKTTPVTTPKTTPATPPKTTLVITPPTTPAQPTTSTIVDEENDHHDEDHHKEHIEENEQEQEHDED
jgi:hypothetical protein